MKAFVGPAGSGKTWQLMSEVDAWLGSTALKDDQAVLALTRMHGARKRLVQRLQSSKARRCFRCMTIDRFAWLIASRWRSLAQERGISTAGHSVDYEATASAAAALLTCSEVSRWIRERHPLIVVDELQDCRDGQLAMVRALAPSGELLVAADEFQDLSKSGDAPAVRWLREIGQFKPLTGNQRTKKSGLRQAAEDIRGGAPITQGKGFKILAALNPDVAAKFLAERIHWSHSAQAELVILSSAAPDRSRFVRRALDRLSAKAFNLNGKKIGPYKVRWNGSQSMRVGTLCAKLDLPNEEGALVDLGKLTCLEPEGIGAFDDWCSRRRRLGSGVATAGEVRNAVQRCVQQSRAWACEPSGVWGTTIHGAKNREFQRVVVLWPFEAGKDELSARLLYNGITRAREDAVVIVQENPKVSRLNEPPFSGRPKPPACRASPPIQQVFPGMESSAPQQLRRKKAR